MLWPGYLEDLVKQVQALLLGDSLVLREQVAVEQLERELALGMSPPALRYCAANRAMSRKTAGPMSFSDLSAISAARVCRMISACSAGRPSSSRFHRVAKTAGSGEGLL